MGLIRLLHQIDKISDSESSRGIHFEYLVQSYFKNEPAFRNLFSDVWMLNEVPVEYGIAKSDLGVDLVAKKHNGALVGIQAKYYSKPIMKSDIDSFLSELGKDYYESGIIVTTVDKWGKNAEKALENRSDVSRIGLSDLKNSEIDWEKFSFLDPQKIVMKEPKKLRDYQIEAVSKAIDAFEKDDRGQLIMAPGTGKTYTSLKIVEQMAKSSSKNTFYVLYLVPSIQLLTQSLRSWNNDTELSIESFAITSDRNASKGNIKQDESNITTRSVDIGYPATTSSEKIIENYNKYLSGIAKELVVVFSTYQSIDVIGEAQKDGFPEFDLIISDEAHRTTGAAVLGEGDSAFVKVHSNENVIGRKRLYQTATPKLYGEDAKRKAIESSIVVSSMDDEAIYGKVFFRLGFGDAIARNYLSDYKLMVLAVDENAIQKDMQRTLSDPENGLGLDDIGKIIGIWNGMIKRESFSDVVSGKPMKRAIAFSRTIKDSKRIANEFETIINDYLDFDDGYSVNVKHADGGMNALEKNNLLDWLAEDNINENNARILSNVRFLTEGIDVPNLDAIIFLSPKRSQVDIVQAVGRIIRKHKDKDYGYIILPIVIPAGTAPEEILDNNKTYDVIWQVLNALRSVDERFEATVNKLQLNRHKPENIRIIGVGTSPKSPNMDQKHPDYHEQLSMNLEWEAVEGAIYGKIVQKVGDRKYLEDWSEDVARIANRYINYINVILEKNEDAKRSFSRFIRSLRHNINKSISRDQAIEMIAQHLITLPVFEALFDEYSFVRNNAVGKSMESIIKDFSKYGFEKEQEELIPFYESVKLRTSGIDNSEAKQKIIITLYDNFFSKAFKSTTERLGIVFTPLEVVDFIIESVDHVLEKHFGKRIYSEDVNILDPFTGTGTFVVQLLRLLDKEFKQGNIIKEDLIRKYTQELHANEIVLLSYYIAAINIETTFADINNGKYEPFPGIVLTDTFQSSENDDSFTDILFDENDERIRKQKSSKITAVIGNPPYSIGQSNANDSNQNSSHPNLEKSILNTYAKSSKTNLAKSLYDSYIKSFRWASNKIEDKGVIAYVTNASYIDSSSTDGFRASVYKEFNHIYVFNLRGDARTQGEQRRKESGNIFGGGSRTPIAITLLIKDGSKDHKIYYNDIGDYLSREEKLKIVSEKGSISNIEWVELIPDTNNDWINQIDLKYETYPPLSMGYFHDNAIGVNTSRDEWVYSFSESKLKENVGRMVSNYNSEVKKYIRLKDKTKAFSNRNMDPKDIKWSVGLNNSYKRGEIIHNNDDHVILSMYRPFTKKHLYYQRNLVERPGRYREKFSKENHVIYVTGKGAARDFSALIVEYIPNLHLMDTGQGFYLKSGESSNNLALFSDEHNISSVISNKLEISQEDLTAYVYGVLHSTEYKEKYANELKKGLPRIPIYKQLDEFIRIGKKLIELHLNYEDVIHLSTLDIEYMNDHNYEVKKMKHPSRNDKSSIIFNESITIKNIPEKAYEYLVNGKPAIQWIMEQYMVPTRSNSGIIDDPNLFSSNPKYIFNLLLSIISLSVKTVELCEELPKLEIDDERMEILNE